MESLSTEANTLILVMVFFVLEWIEIKSHRGETLKEFLLSHHSAYERNPLTYIGTHFSFFFLIYIVVATNAVNFWILSVLSLKCADVVLKLLLIERVSKEGADAIDQFFGGMEIHLTPGVRYFSLFLYTSMLFLGLT